MQNIANELDAYEPTSTDVTGIKNLVLRLITQEDPVLQHACLWKHTVKTYSTGSFRESGADWTTCDPQNSP